MKRVHALYRVSTIKQGMEDEIPMQKAECQRYAKQHGWTIIKEHTEKVSGFQVPLAERTDLLEILEDAKEGLFDILLVYSVDRLGRQVEFLPYYGQLEEHNVQVWSAKEDRLSGQEHVDMLYQFMGLWVAEGESRKTSARVKDTFNQMFESGEYTTGNASFGYDIFDTGVRRNPNKSKTMKKVIINKDEAEIVKLIFDLAGNKGWGSPRISKYLNEESIPNRKGKIWRNSSIYRIIRNPIYIGYRSYNRSVKTSLKSKNRKSLSYKEWKLQPFNEELVIIPKDLFNKVQEQTTSRGTEKKTDVPTNSMVLLSGILFCGECGKKLNSDFTYSSRKAKDGTVEKYKLYRYRCQSAINYKHEGRVTFGAKHLDPAIGEMVKLAIKSIRIETLQSEIEQFKSKEVTLKKQQLDNLVLDELKFRKGLEKAENEMEKTFLDESNFTEVQIVKLINNFKDKLEVVQQQIAELKGELNKSKVTTADLESFMGNLEGWESIYENSDLDSKKVMLGDIVEKVVITNDKVRIFYKGSYEAFLGKGIN